MSREKETQPEQHLDEDTALDVALGLGSSVARSHLRACPPCAELVRQAAASLERTRAAGRLRRRADGDLELDAAVADRTRWRAGRWTSAVAVAAVAAAMAWVLVSPPPIVDLPVYWLPSDLTDLTRSAASDEFVAGLALYQQGLAAESAAQLEAGEVDTELRPLRDLYLASALTLDDRHLEAVELLDRLRGEYLPAPWRNRARWTLYRALLGSGQNERAAGLLERLSEESDEIGDLARRAVAARSR